LNPKPEKPQRILEWRASFESELDRRLGPGGSTPDGLLEAMRYSALAGGKRMRPLMVYAAAEALDLDWREVHGIACAIEAIHAYSLIHDDLPAMDDDDLRRGRPTCHKAFDEATAILAGDALQALAFEILATDPSLSKKPAAQAAVIGLIAAACGASGMAGGQVLDLRAIDQELTLEDLETMHRLKTGALIRASATAPAVFASADAQLRGRLESYGDLVGLAFQIHDDILDVTGNTLQTGKPAQADAARNKPAFPSVIGMQASRQQAERLGTAAIEQLEGFPGDTTVLRWLAAYSIERDS
jgi:farnesyl diphosphate synthase